MVDTDPPPVIAELDYDAPMYRSSAFHWASRLIFIASKVMSRVYSLKPGISLSQRQAMVPELHLLLESWCVALLSRLCRAHRLLHGAYETAVTQGGS